MSVESDLVAELEAICPRVYPDVAPEGTSEPYVVYQHIGGRPLRFIEGTAASLRNSIIQISVWSLGKAEAMSMIRSIEDALCVSGNFTAEPEGEPLSTYEPQTRRYGSLQDFSLWAER